MPVIDDNVITPIMSNLCSIALNAPPAANVMQPKKSRSCMRVEIVEKSPATEASRDIKNLGNVKDMCLSKRSHQCAFALSSVPPWFSLKRHVNCMANTRYESCKNACNECADECEICVTACLQGDAKMMAKCIQICRDCVDACSICARLLARDSDLVKQACEFCAAVCDECAKECDKHASHMDECKKCAQACRMCASECRKIAK